MKIYQCCPYYNEKLIANININEASKWIDEFHILEANRNFQNKERGYNFDLNLDDNGKVKYHKFDATKKYVSSNIFGKLKLIKYRFKKNKYKKNILSNPAWYNESIQRNLSTAFIDLKDDDIIILSDIDEIIDSRYAQKIIKEVKKREIVTIPLHFTLFYFNLFSINWNGPKNYSYRMFVMTGKKFKNLGMNYDELRKKGEHGELVEEIFCMEEICGFHHSWLGDEKFILNKINSYAHVEHRKYGDINYIKECLNNGKSIFPGHQVEVKNKINQLQTVENMKEKQLFKYFL